MEEALARRTSTALVAAVCIAAIAIAAAAPRLRLILASPAIVDADESVVALMAERIARCEDLPVFHYGNAYLGSLDAIAAGALRAAGGGGAATLRTVSLLLSLGLVAVTFLLGRSVGGVRTGLLSALWLALGPGFLVIWGAKLHLGYLDIAILGGLLFLLVLTEDRTRPEGRLPARMFAAGLLCGLGLWLHVLFAVYITSAVLFLAARGAHRRLRWRQTVGFAAGALVGGLPLLLYNLEHGWATIRMFTAGVPSGSLIVRLGSGVYTLVAAMAPVITGAAMPWHVFRPELATELPLPLAQLALAAVAVLATMAWVAWTSRWMASKAAAGRSRRCRLAALIALAASVAGLAALLVLTDWTSLPRGMEPRLPLVTLELARFELSHLRLAATAFVLLPALALAVLAAGSRSCLAPGRETGGEASRLRCGARLLLLHALIAACFFVATSYGAFRSPRFLFPLYTSLPVLVGVAGTLLAHRSRAVAAGWFASVLLLNVGLGMAEPAHRCLEPVHLVDVVPVPDSYEPIAAALRDLGVTSVYGSYWTAFPLIHASAERIMVSNGQTGRLREADAAVAASPTPAFFFYRDKLDGRQFRRLLEANGIPHHTLIVGPFDVHTGIDATALRASPIWPRLLEAMSHP